jgi:hypothetical protein
MLLISMLRRMAVRVKPRPKFSVSRPRICAEHATIEGAKAVIQRRQDGAGERAVSVSDNCVVHSLRRFALIEERKSEAV